MTKKTIFTFIISSCIVCAVSAQSNKEQKPQLSPVTLHKGLSVQTKGGGRTLSASTTQPSKVQESSTSTTAPSTPSAEVASRIAALEKIVNNPSYPADKRNNARLHLEKLQKTQK